MNRGIEKRITTLEQQRGAQVTAATHHKVYADAGIDVPAPIPNEGADEYTNRLPSDAQLKLLAFYGVEL